ncbi:hypothetical protein ABIA39_003292 [Nocardia sp. GAS34]
MALLPSGRVGTSGVAGYAMTLEAIAEAARAEGRDVVERAEEVARRAAPELRVSGKVGADNPANLLIDRSATAFAVVLGSTGSAGTLAHLGSTLLAVTAHAQRARHRRGLRRGGRTPHRARGRTRLFRLGFRSLRRYGHADSRRGRRSSRVGNSRRTSRRLARGIPRRPGDSADIPVRARRQAAGILEDGATDRRRQPRPRRSSRPASRVDIQLPCAARILPRDGRPSGTKIVHTAPTIPMDLVTEAVGE